MSQSRKRRILISALAGVVVSAFLGFVPGPSVAAPTVRVMPSGDGLTLEYQDGSGATLQETIPIHQAGGIKYFSAGVGLEERSAAYPPYSLKLVFVAGPKAYLSQVSVTVKDKDGTTVVAVPREQVTGPWLFVDLPPGTYAITAVGPAKSEVKERVTISAKQMKTVYLRWKGETA